MKRVAAAALLLNLLLVCAMPAQAQEQRATGPLMRAVHKEANRLVAARQNVGPTIHGEERSGASGPRERRAWRGAGAPAIQDWSRVTGLAPGREIFVELRGTPSVSRYFVTADESELIVLDLADPPLTPEVRRALREVASTHPEYLLQVFGGSRFVEDDVRLAPDGVFLANRKVAEISDVVKRIPRPDVVGVTTPPKRRGSLIGTAIGAGGGFVLGFVSALHLAYKQCNGSCSDEKALMALSLVGLPIAGGWLGYQANPRTTQDVIYRAPTQEP